MYSIILSGGVGTRLWPLSRTFYPKQFIKLKNSERSLFQLTFIRCLSLSDISKIYIVTNKNYKFLTIGQIEELGYTINPAQVLIEPEGRNTLPAIYYAIREIQKHCDDVVAVFPSDHIIGDKEGFIKAVQNGEALANEFLVTFGIVPSKPHTGYGYIKPGQIMHNGYKVEEFKEKPDQCTAIKYMNNGYLWNSGMFIFRTDIFVSELKKHNPQVYSAFKYDNIEECYSLTPNISIDYGLMEKSSLVVVVPLNVRWSDLGSFDSFYEEFPGDEDGNIKFNSDFMIDSYNNLLYTNQDKAVAMVGVDNLIVIDEKDALLICKKDHSQKVKEVVSKLAEKNDKRLDHHVTTYRPWGSYTVLEEGVFYKIKRITVMPGKKLSYQSHHHRSEHWIVVKGTASVTIEGDNTIVRNGESTYVKAGLKHRLENPGLIPLEVIEVQLGEYLEEDDIIRFDDDFGRSDYAVCKENVDK